MTVSCMVCMEPMMSVIMMVLDILWASVRGIENKHLYWRNNFYGICWL